MMLPLRLNLSVPMRTSSSQRPVDLPSSQGVRHTVSQSCESDHLGKRQSSMLEPNLTLQPIGILRSSRQVKFDTPHQPEESVPERHLLELAPHCNFEQALQDLSGFSRIWLIWWFHRNARWRPLVLPPRGPAQRRGLFATRSPHRPNPIGLTSVRLLGVEGRSLVLGSSDLVDGTPVFDIKPYVTGYDSFPDECNGWIDEVDELQASPPEFSVNLTEGALVQAEWLKTHWQIDFRPRLIELLSRDPSLHRTRRITRRGPDRFAIGCGAWRAVFTVKEQAVTIHGLEAGYPLRFLHDPAQTGPLPDKAAQLAYHAQWPQE